MTPSRKRRLAKVAYATQELCAAVMSLRYLQRRHKNAWKLANSDMRWLYYLSRLARKAP